MARRQFSKEQLSVGYLFNSYWFGTTDYNEQRYGKMQGCQLEVFYIFEHESTKGSCMYLGFSENSITLAAETLLRNINKRGKLIKGPNLSFLELKADIILGSAVPRLLNALVCFSIWANGKQS